MCDYSLDACASRDAVIDDELETGHILIYGRAPTATSGFRASEGRDIAVCLRPGTELAFTEKVRFTRYYPVGHCLEIDEKPFATAIFREINLDQTYAHHDALEFPDGSIVLVTHLVAGQRARVLQLGVEPKKASAEDNHRPVAYDESGHAVAAVAGEWLR